MSTWRELIQAAMDVAEDSFDDVVSSTLTEAQLDEVFDDSYGIEEGEPFTLWTKHGFTFLCVTMVRNGVGPYQGIRMVKPLIILVAVK